MKAIIEAARSTGLSFGRKQFTDWRGGGWQPMGGYGSAGSPAKVTQALNTYGGTEESSAAVFACVTKIAHELAGYQWQITDQQDKILERPQPDPELWALLDEPSPETTYFDFVADCETDVCLVGNSFWLADEQNALSQPRVLHRLQPQLMKVATNEQGKKIGYVYMLGGREIPFGLNDIIHFRTRNPYNPHLGMGTVEAIYREINADIAEAEHVSAFFTNGARVSGVLTVPENVSEGDWQRLKAEIEQYGGPGQAYRTLLAAGGGSYSPVTQAPVASGVIELRRMSQDAIYKGFGVPEFLLGGTAQGGVYKMSEAQFIFYRNMLPRARRFQERMTLSLTGRWEGTKFVSLPELNEPEQDKLANAGEKLKTGSSLNEVRRYQGQELIDDPRADEPLLPVGFLPWSQAIQPQNQQGAQQQPPQQNLPPGAQTLGVEPLRVPREGQAKSVLPAPPSYPTEVVKDADVIEHQQPVIEEFIIVQPTLPPGFEQRGVIEPKAAKRKHTQSLVEGQAAFLISATPVIEKAITKFLAGQRQRVLNDVQGSTRSRMSADEKAAAFKGLWKSGRENEALSKAFLEAVDQVAPDALKAVNPIITQDIAWDQQHEYVWTARGRLGKNIVRINNTTRRAISKEVQEGVRRGYSPRQIANGVPDENYKGIMGVFDQASESRAETIARTETATLFNAASLAAYRHNDIGEVEVIDGNYDGKCAEANGQTWTMAKAIRNQLEHPNCVRAFVPVVKTSARSIPTSPEIPTDAGPVFLVAA